METAEPEEEDELEIDEEGRIQGTFRVDRNCEECGTTLKCATFEVDDTIDQAVLDAHTNDEGKDGPHELSVETDGSEVEESGGGRYKKNLFTVVVQYTVTCECDDTFKHDGELRSSPVAAGEFEEQV